MPVSFLSKSYSRDGLVPPNPFYNIGLDTSFISDVDEVATLPPQATYAALVNEVSAKNPIDTHFNRETATILNQILKTLKEPEPLTKAKMIARQQKNNEINKAIVDQIDQSTKFGVQTQTYGSSPRTDLSLREEEEDTEMAEPALPIEASRMVNPIVSSTGFEQARNEIIPVVADDQVLPPVVTNSGVVNNYFDNRTFIESTLQSVQSSEQNLWAAQFVSGMEPDDTLGWDYEQPAEPAQITQGDNNTINISDFIDINVLASGSTQSGDTAAQLEEPHPQLMITEAPATVTDIEDYDRSLVQPEEEVIIGSRNTSANVINEEGLTRQENVSVVDDATRKEIRQGKRNLFQGTKRAIISPQSFPIELRGSETPKNTTGYDFITIDKRGRLQYTTEDRKIFVNRQSGESDNDYYKRAIDEALANRKSRKRKAGASLPKNPDIPGPSGIKSIPISPPKTPQVNNDQLAAKRTLKKVKRKPSVDLQQGKKKVIKSSEPDKPKSLEENSAATNAQPNNIQLALNASGDQIKQEFIKQGYSLTNIQFRKGYARFVLPNGQWEAVAPDNNESLEDYAIDFMRQFRERGRQPTDKRKRKPSVDLQQPKKKASKKSKADPEKTKEIMGIPKDD